MDLPEVELELRVQKCDFGPLEDLGHEVASLLEDLDGDVERGNEQLRLDVLVHIVEACYIGSAVADH